MNVERLEILISRSLDGEITPVEQRELDALLNESDEARAIFDDYRQLDVVAAAAIKADFVGGSRFATQRISHPPSGRQSWRNSFMVGASAALLAAAAMIVVASIPWAGLFSNGQPIVKRDWPEGTPSYPRAVEPMRVDYRHPAYQPQQLRGDVYRDVIGIQGDDPNVIIIFERQTRESQLSPVVGDI